MGESTSAPPAVRGLDAKPIIDSQILVAEFEPMAAYKTPLMRLGFVHRADNPELTKRYFREPPGAARTHIRRAGSFSEHFALLFRERPPNTQKSASPWSASAWAAAAAVGGVADHGGVHPVVVPPPARTPRRVDDALWLLAHASAPLNPAKIAAVLQLLGTAGRPPASTTAVAAALGQSVWNVRLLRNPAREVAHRAGAPRSLREANRRLGRRVRITPEAALELRATGLTAGVLHPSTVLLAAEWFGLTPAADTYRLPDGTTLVVPAVQQRKFAAASGRMRFWCMSQGIATVADLAARTGLSRDIVEQLVTAPGLGRHGRHVWVVPDTGLNVIRSSVYRQLALRPRAVADLHAGIISATRIRPRRQTPPRDVLRAYLLAQPDYHLEGDLVHLVDSGGAALTRTDAAIVEAFRTTGQAVLTMPELSQALLAAGLAEPGVKTPVIGCPLLRRVSPGRYALAGAGTDPMTAVGGHR